MLQDSTCLLCYQERNTIILLVALRYSLTLFAHEHPANPRIKVAHTLLCSSTQYIRPFCDHTQTTEGYNGYEARSMTAI